MLSFRLAYFDSHIVLRQGRLSENESHAQYFADSRLREFSENHVYKERSFPSSIAPYQSIHSRLALSTANLELLRGASNRPLMTEKGQPLLQSLPSSRQ